MGVFFKVDGSHRASAICTATLRRLIVAHNEIAKMSYQRVNLILYDLAFLDVFSRLQYLLNLRIVHELRDLANLALRYLIRIVR